MTNDKRESFGMSLSVSNCKTVYNYLYIPPLHHHENKVISVVECESIGYSSQELRKDVPIMLDFLKLSQAFFEQLPRESAQCLLSLWAAFRHYNDKLCSGGICLQQKFLLSHQSWIPYWQAVGDKREDVCGGEPRLYEWVRQDE